MPSLDQILFAGAFGAVLLGGIGKVKLSVAIPLAGVLIVAALVLKPRDEISAATL